MKDNNNPDIPHYCKGSCGQLTRFVKGAWKPFVEGHYIKGGHNLEESIKIYNDTKPNLDILCNPTIPHFCECEKKCGQITNFDEGKWRTYIDGHENVGKTKNNSPGVRRMAEKLRGRRKETHLSLKQQSEKMKGRTKENHLGVKRQAEKIRGRTKENHSGVRQQAEKLRGRTKKNHLYLREISRKSRIYSSKRFIETGSPMNVGKQEKEILDEREKEENIKIERQYYIPYLGIWLDGYNKQFNIAYEVDEPYHFDIAGNMKERHIIRQKEVEDYLHCKFIRIRESDWLKQKLNTVKSCAEQELV